jgi:phenol 2-monooxygenase
MQFHLNGFNVGDPAIARPEGSGLDPRSEALPAEADVLIVGCGPAGLTLAAQLSAFPEIRTCIAEQKDGPLTLGQADGIACRTMEVFEALGFAERVLKESYWVNETVFWKPDSEQRSSIARSGRIQDTEDGLSEMPHVILNQARVHDFLLETMRNAPTRLEPHYSRRLLELSVDPAAADYPLTAVFERTNGGAATQTETVRARYAVGCDGARSAVRKSLGMPLLGDAANQAWGVMDVLAVTDFPDVRLKAVIHSANEGNMLIIPREGGYLVRLYIELDELKKDERVASRNITVDYLIAAAKRILAPYSLEVKEVAWWSVYEIGQRLSDRFDDGDATGGRQPRVFIAGDACHTHSPKAGQGMNVSLNDAFNLGWKLAAVLRGQSAPALLETYSAERRGVAKALIDFDRELAAMFSAPPKDPNDPDSEGVDPAEFQAYFVKQGRFTAGTAVHYAPSIIVGAGRRQDHAPGFNRGKRLHSPPVIRLADARPMHLGHALKADGRWRLLAFAAAEDPADPASRLRRLCDVLANAEASPLRWSRPADGDVDAVIDVRAVLQQPHREVRLQDMPPLLVPHKGRYGLKDYEKVFCPDFRAGDIFDLREVDRAAGCMVLVRPDQYVAEVLPLDAYDELAAFFTRFMAHPAG